MLVVWYKFYNKSYNYKVLIYKSSIVTIIVNLDKSDSKYFVVTLLLSYLF